MLTLWPSKITNPKMHFGFVVPYQVLGIGHSHFVMFGFDVWRIFYVFGHFLDLKFFGPFPWQASGRQCKRAQGTFGIVELFTSGFLRSPATWHAQVFIMPTST